MSARLVEAAAAIRSGLFVTHDALKQLVLEAADSLHSPAEAQAQDIGPEWKPCRKRPVIVHVREQRPGEQHVSTREGITAVKPDDLIMRGVEGEEYPIGRELFAKTYDLAEAQAQGGGEVAGPMTGDLLPCPFCGKSNQDRWPCEWLDGTGANVIRCAWCHGAAPASTWNRRTAPPSAPVGVEAFESRLRGRAGPFTAQPGEWYVDADIALSVLREALAQQPGAVDDLNAWRAAFVEERATRYREGGMAIEQARIHAETDAARMDREAGQQPAVVDGYTTGHCERHKQPGGCDLHNLSCGWPSCDRRPAAQPGGAE